MQQKFVCVSIHLEQEKDTLHNQYKNVNCMLSYGEPSTAEGVSLCGETLDHTEIITSLFLVFLAL